MIPPGDSLFRAALDSVFSSPAYDWRPPPVGTATFVRWWNGLVGWLNRLREADPALFRLFTVALVVVLLAVLAHAAVVFLRTVRGAVRRDESAGPASAPLRGPDWHFREADRLAASGRFREALPELFLALALRLDGRGLLAYRASKTPVECAREARLAASDRGRLTRLVRELYAAVFGGATCGPAEYAAWRAAALGDWHAAAG